MGRVERERALRILGLSRAAGEREREAAHRALRAHVEARAQARPDDPAAQRARESELRELEAVLDALGPAPRARPGAGGLAGVGHRRGVRALAAGVLALACVLLVWTGRRSSEGPSGDAERGADAGAAVVVEPVESDESDDLAPPVAEGVVSERAELVAEANVAGAILRVRVAAGGPPVLEGPADTRSYWLTEGEYALEVVHPDCPDRWRETLLAEPGAHIGLAPEVCRNTGWLEVRANVEGARLVVDDEVSPSVLPERRTVTVGEHVVEARKEGYRAFRGLVAIEPGETREIFAELEPVPHAAASPPPSTADADAATRDGAARRLLWHEQTTRYLLSRYDRDGSGLLDRTDEIARISCDEWRRLEADFDRGRLGLSLTHAYGFNDVGLWVGNALGVSRDMRQHAALRMRECGLRP